jgi:hypothetical protein
MKATYIFEISHHLMIPIRMKQTDKPGSNSFFTMGSFDGAEICELVGLFILNNLGKRFGKENIGLYRDDGLAIIKSKSARLLDKTRKELHKIFDLKILIINPGWYYNI